MCNFIVWFTECCFEVVNIINKSAKMWLNCQNLELTTTQNIINTFSQHIMVNKGYLKDVDKSN